MCSIQSRRQRVCTWMPRVCTALVTTPACGRQERNPCCRPLFSVSSFPGTTNRSARRRLPGRMIHTLQCFVFWYTEVCRCMHSSRYMNVRATPAVLGILFCTKRVRSQPPSLRRSALPCPGIVVHVCHVGVVGFARVTHVHLGCACVWVCLLI